MLEHNHTHSCGCNSHKHDNNHSCGCHSKGGTTNCCGKHSHVSASDIDKTDIHLLEHILEHNYLPVARFVVKSSKTEDFLSVVLNPVFINQKNDSMENIKKIGARLENLEKLGLITIDYDIPLNNYPYDEYYYSDIYTYFKETVNQAKDKDGFLGDIAEIECGSIAPTNKCVEIINKE